MLLFPGDGIPFLYNHVPQIAYLGIFLQGYGCQIIGLASLSAVEEMHRMVGGRPYTSKNSSTAATLWLCGWMMAVYGGHLVALMAMELMSYIHSGWMAAAFSALSLTMSLVQDIAIKRSVAARSKPKDYHHIAQGLRHIVPYHVHRRSMSYGYGLLSQNSTMEIRRPSQQNGDGVV